MFIPDNTACCRMRDAQTALTSETQTPYHPVMLLLLLLLLLLLVNITIIMIMILLHHYCTHYYRYL